MSNSDGGNAFPELKALYNESFCRQTAVNASGMTLRDYFAAKAMQTYLSADISQDDSDIALNAYALADAMLAERAK